MSYDAKFVVELKEIDRKLKTLEDKLKINSFKDDRGNIILQDRVRGISIIFYTSSNYENVDVVAICPKDCIEILEKVLGKPKSVKKRKPTVKTFVKTLVELYEKEKLSPRQALMNTVNFFEIDKKTLKTYAGGIKAIGSTTNAPHELKVAYKILKSAKVL